MVSMALARLCQPKRRVWEASDLFAKKLMSFVNECMDDLYLSQEIILEAVSRGTVYE